MPVIVTTQPILTVLAMSTMATMWVTTLTPSAQLFKKCAYMVKAI